MGGLGGMECTTEARGSTSSGCCSFTRPPLAPRIGSATCACSGPNDNGHDAGFSRGGVSGFFAAAGHPFTRVGLLSISVFFCLLEDKGAVFILHAGRHLPMQASWGLGLASSDDLPALPCHGPPVLEHAWATSHAGRTSMGHRMYLLTYILLVHSIGLAGLSLHNTIITIGSRQMVGYPSTHEEPLHIMGSIRRVPGIHRNNNLRGFLGSALLSKVDCAGVDQRPGGRAMELPGARSPG